VADTPDRVAASGVSHMDAYAWWSVCNWTRVRAWICRPDRAELQESTGEEGPDQITFETDRVAAW